MNNKTKYITGIFLFCLLLGFFCTILMIHTQSADTMTTLWQFQSIDTMKYSRDAAGDKNVLKKVPFFVKQVADMKATYIAIGTPYDEEFYPVLSAWVTEARKHNLKIWFRGNFSSWEGWFNRQKMKNPADHHAMVKKFIIDHPDLFQDGDIFTPVPEPENGAIGDPRSSDEKAKQFNQFLIDSYNNCLDSFQLINKDIHCGYFSMNGDVAKTILTKNTVAHTGGIIVVDHYVDSPEKMARDIENLYTKLGGKIVLGEFGAPIPDINGTMTEIDQANFVDRLLQVFYTKHTIIEGINYWVLAGGSTSLLNDDNSPRLVTQVIKKYYSPNVWKGKITDTAGDTIFNANILVDNKKGQVSFANNGEYTFTTPSDSFSLKINNEGYTQKTETISFANQKEISQAITLEPINPSLWYRLKLFLNTLFIHSFISHSFN